jgi:hypothetical protein
MMQKFGTQSATTVVEQIKCLTNYLSKFRRITMNIFKKTILGAALAVASSGAFASTLATVGGLTWDTEGSFDYWATGTFFESPLSLTVGNTITAYGKVSTINNAAVSCNACEFTYVLSYVFAGVSGNPFAPLSFSNVSLNFYTDTSLDYTNNPLTPNMAKAGNGALFLGLEGNGNVWGSANGSGTGFLNVKSGVAGGAAAQYFNTNIFTSANAPLGTEGQRITGTADIYMYAIGNPGFGIPLDPTHPINGTANIIGNTVKVPEPASLALLGMGLLGFGASRMKKQA